MTQKKGYFDNLNVSNDGKRAAFWGKSIIGGAGNESYSIDIDDPEGSFKSYGKGCRSNISPDGRFILKNGFENFHKEFFIIEYGTDKVLRKFEGSAVNYHKWPNARDGQNYVLFMTFGSSLLMSDVTNGDTWMIRKSRKRSDVVNGFDYVSQPLSEVLGGAKIPKKSASGGGAPKLAKNKGKTDGDALDSETIKGRVTVVLSEASTLTDPENRIIKTP